MKTLEEEKAVTSQSVLDTVAFEYGYLTYRVAVEGGFHVTPTFIKRAMEMFATIKVSEQRELMSNHLNMRNVPKPKI